MSDDYGGKIAQAFAAIYQLHEDTSKLLQDCDGAIAKGRSSVFGNVAIRDLSRTVGEWGSWMPSALYRFYEASDESPGLVEGVTVYYWDDPPMEEGEPLLLVGRIGYHVEPEIGIKDSCKEWDLYLAYTSWCDQRRLHTVTSGRDLDEGRIDWLKLIAAPLYSINSIADVQALMEKLRV